MLPRVASLLLLLLCAGATAFVAPATPLCSRAAVCTTPAANGITMIVRAPTAHTPARPRLPLPGSVCP